MIFREHLFLLLHHFHLQISAGKQDKQRAIEIQKIIENSQAPKYVETRLETWNTLTTKYQEELSTKPKTLIKVSLPNDKIIEGTAWQSSPYDIAKTVSEKFANKLIVARVNNQIWDMSRPLERNCNIEFLSFNDEDGREVFWHSTTLVLGEALETLYGGLLCCGPATTEGFYYDLWNNGKGVNLKKTYLFFHENFSMITYVLQISSNDREIIETLMKSIIKRQSPYERLVISKADALELFSYNKFKLEILEKRVDEDTTVVYRCGNLIDLCTGPHLQHTGQIKTVKILNVRISIKLLQIKKSL